MAAILGQPDMTNNATSIETVSVDDLVPYEHNARTHTQRQILQIAEAIRQFGFINPVIANADNMIMAGHGRVLAAMELDLDEVPVIRVEHLTQDQIRTYILADNRLAENAGWDEATLAVELHELVNLDLGFDVNITGFDNDDMVKLFEDNITLDPTSPVTPVTAPETPQPTSRVSLSDRFGVNPFTVLNARESWWQQRKKSWINLGIRSEVGRGGVAAMDNQQALNDQIRDREQEDGIDNGTRNATGTSVFDPVLCELAYSWFCPPEGVVLDPFAGGSVRGIVASRLGRQYVGVDLRQDQIDSNNDQIEIAGQTRPLWVCGDSADLSVLCPDIEADMIFTCPPYADLEVYSDLGADISNMPYSQFLEAYRLIIYQSCEMLKENRFACVTVGEARDGDGNYYGLVADTIKAFQDAGTHFYNEAIYVTPNGSLPVRSGRPFEVSRKLGKCHQNFLVFVKGDPREATAAIGPVEFGPEDISPPVEMSEVRRRVTS